MGHSPTPPPGSAGKAAGGSLAEWKSGATKMTTAAAGDHVAKTAPLKPNKPKVKPSKPAPSNKPWHEQSIAERYGTQPPKITPSASKQLSDALKYLRAVQDRGCISWDEIITQGIPPW